MYTERVSEIIDDLIFDDRHLSRQEMRSEGIRLILEADLRMAGWNRSYIKPLYSKKPLELARNYYDPDVREEDESENSRRTVILNPYFRQRAM